MIEKYTTPFSEIHKIIIPASTLGGLCLLVGKCWALGFQSFDYISSTDIIRSTLIFFPLLIIFFFVVFILISVNKNTENKKNATKIEKIYLSFVDYPLIMTFGFFLIFISNNIDFNYQFNYIANVLLYYSSWIFFINYCVFLRRKIDKHDIEEKHAIIIFYLLISFFVTTSSYSFYKNIISDIGKRYDQKICIKDNCWNGRTISRFSDATYFKAEDNGAQIIINNSEITVIKSIY